MFQRKISISKQNLSAYRQKSRAYPLYNLWSAIFILNGSDWSRFLTAIWIEQSVNFAIATGSPFFSRPCAVIPEILGISVEVVIALGRLPAVGAVFVTEDGLSVAWNPNQETVKIAGTNLAEYARIMRDSFQPVLGEGLVKMNNVRV